ncbi:MAG: DUF4258 domain-containing protein [Crenarchaeota archaeon]|nr:DUF4258 domain-containing protein [Thermoproteota archaeon]
MYKTGNILTILEETKALTNPDEIIRGYRDKLITHKYKDKYVLHVIFERKENIIIIITVYRARRSRYERKR